MAVRFNLIPGVAFSGSFGEFWGLGVLGTGSSGSAWSRNNALFQGFLVSLTGFKVWDSVDPF